MIKDKIERLKEINEILSRNSLVQLKTIGDRAKGEIEILEIIEINKDPNFRGYCMITFKCFVKDKRTGLLKEVNYSKKFSYKSNKHCGVIIVAITVNDELIMPISYRLCYGWRSECPRGYPKGHLPLEDARIELESETGYIVEEIKIIQTVDEDTGTSAMSPTIILATGCKKQKPTHQCHDTEIICPIKETLIPVKEINKAIRNGKIRDELSLSAIMIAKAHGYL